MAAILAAGLLATACDTNETTEPAARPGDTAMAEATGPDSMSVDMPTDAAGYARRAAISDMYEIEAGKLAIDRAGSAETRAFARMMVEDHEASTRDLKAALQQVDMEIALPEQLDAEHQAKMDVLASLDGENFDREYMSQQVAAHRQALALHEGYAARGDNQALQTFAGEVVPVIRAHREELENAGAMMDERAGTTATTGRDAAWDDNGMRESHPDANN